jgi:hypothetical protein
MIKKIGKLRKATLARQSRIAIGAMILQRVKDSHWKVKVQFYGSELNPVGRIRVLRQLALTLAIGADEFKAPSSVTQHRSPDHAPFAASCNTRICPWLSLVQYISSMLRRSHRKSKGGCLEW